MIMLSNNDINKQKIKLFVNFLLWFASQFPFPSGLDLKLTELLLRGKPTLGSII